MARTWNSYEDVRQVIYTIKEIMLQAGALPDALVQAYQESLKTARAGLVQSFYTGIVAECPSALKYFTKTEDMKAEETKTKEITIEDIKAIGDIKTEE